MKTILIILCAFLIKAEAEAQTWGKISPVELNPISLVKIIKDNKEKLHVFATNDNVSKLYYLKNGKDWLISGPVYAGICHTYSDKYGPQQLPANYRFEDVIELDNQHIMLQAEMECAGSMDYIFKGLGDSYEKYNRRWKIRLDTFNYFEAYRPFMDTVISGSMLGKYSLRNKVFYNNTYYFDDKGILIPDSLVTYNEKTLLRSSYQKPLEGIAIYDPRKDSTVYNFNFGEVLRSENNGKNWDTVQFADFTKYVFEDEEFYANIVFLENNLQSVFLKTPQRLIRFKENSLESFVVLNVKVTELVNVKNSNVAYAGSDAGIIYRSTDAGETWSPFASGFSTKPVIGIYASGNDSLIVGTEDGIWANYALPVSVTEEIPFKNDELTITPNPANTSLKISFLKTDLPQQLSVYNSLGQLVFKTEFSGEFVWDFKNDVPDGIYTVAVQSGGKSVAKQVVILR